MAQRVLVLDDDPVVAKLVRRVTASGNMEMRCSSDVAQFLDLLDEWEPSLLIVNPFSAGTDATALLRRLADRPADIHLICLRPYGKRYSREMKRLLEGRELRLAGIMRKPLQPASLRRLIRFASCHPFGRFTNGFSETGYLAEQLRDAIAGNRIRLAYQPKIDCESGEVVAFEALARWYFSETLVVLPDTFIPLAEQNDLIGGLTLHVLDEGLEWLGAGQADSPLALCVNLSSITLGDIGFVDEADRMCRKRGISARRIIFELTETTAVDDPVMALELVTRLRMKGFHAAIDDVGTGHSSFVQLARLPFSELKIDRTFVQAMGTSEKAAAIVRSFVQLGHNLGLAVIAEGVEDSRSLDYLVETGCDMAQGYYIGRPMPADLASTWLAERQAAGRSSPERTMHNIDTSG